jgi:hypothetical protein
VAVRGGAFALRLTVPHRLVPGRYAVRVREVGVAAIAALPERTLAVRLKAPREGVVDAAFGSGIANGPAASVLDRQRRVFANFHFAALPARDQRITTAWYLGPKQVDPPVVRPRAANVGAYVQFSTGELPAGRYRCVLRAGRTVVAVVSVRLR